jgi:hypothetical protein
MIFNQALLIDKAYPKSRRALASNPPEDGPADQSIVFRNLENAFGMPEKQQLILPLQRRNASK